MIACGEAGVPLPGLLRLHDSLWGSWGPLTGLVKAA